MAAGPAWLQERASQLTNDGSYVGVPEPLNFNLGEANPEFAYLGKCPVGLVFVPSNGPFGMVWQHMVLIHQNLPLQV